MSVEESKGYGERECSHSCEENGLWVSVMVRKSGRKCVCRVKEKCASANTGKRVKGNG